MKAGYLLALASAAIASPIGSIDDYVANIERRADSVSAQDYDNLKFYVQHAAASYCNVNSKPGQAVICGGSCPGVEADKATIVEAFGGGLTGIGGYVAVDHARREIILAARGSINIRNWIADVTFISRTCDLVDGCKVHVGFAAAWDEIKVAATRALTTARNANPDYKIIVTGHSLGGAVASLAAAYLRRDGYVVDAYTFGSPRVGNDHFANFVSSQPGGQWRVTHQDDPVPRLPPIFTGYRHVSPEYWLANGDRKQTEYSLDNIRICPGIANTDCNAGTTGFHFVSHVYYLGHTPACAPFPYNQKRDGQDISDQELEQRLNEWSQKDRDFVQKIKRDEQGISDEELDQRLSEWGQKDQEFVESMKS